MIHQSQFCESDQCKLQLLPFATRPDCGMRDPSLAKAYSVHIASVAAKSAPPVR